MMVKWGFDNSTSGPFLISTRSALLAGGCICAAVGFEESRLPTVVVIASLRTSPFIVIALTSERVGRCATLDLRSSASVVQLWTGNQRAVDIRAGKRRDATDLRRAGRKRRSRDEEVIALRGRRTPAHALTSKGVDVGVRCGRSEERRVGKECRSRWAWKHEKR